MLNTRRLDSMYLLSGGWTNLPEDAENLSLTQVKAVLDLQYTPDDDESLALAVEQELNKYDIKYLSIPFYDYAHLPDDYFTRVFEQGNAFINEQIAYGKVPILIKCGAGVSRSPAMLIYHLCSIHVYESAREALEWIRDKEEGYTSFGVSLNDGFRNYLKERYPYGFEE